tara:strand:+ start:11668 stop:12810 length:1143 start_codon:yes stop_codon:yes gene_type:complete
MLKIKNRAVFDIIISFFFYVQILTINALSDIEYWVFNFSLILIATIFIRKNLNIPLKKMWLFHLFLILWVITDIFVFTIDFFNLGISQLAIGNFFLIAIQLPFLAYLFFYILSNKASLIIFSSISFIISVALYFLWLVGFIEDFKYQIIGNITLFTIIIFISSDILSNKLKLKFVIITALVFIILVVGSRQSLVGLLLMSLILIIQNLKKYFISISLFLVTLFTLINFAFQKNNIDESFSNFTTISRFIANAQLESSSNSYRIESYKQMIDNFSFFPNGYSYTFNPYFNEPHNLFLEIIYLKGYFLGSTIIIFFIALIINLLFYKNLTILKLTILVFTIPAMVSYSLHAGRFFMIGILTLLIYKSLSKKIINKHNSLILK